MENQPLPGPQSSIPELTQANQAAFNAPIVEQQVQAGAQADQATLDRQEAQARIEAERNDPKNYRIVRTATGGMRFIDPTGQEVSVDEYARVTGQTPAGVLQDSEDPQDRQFVQDYQNLQTTINALYNEDAGTLQQMRSRDPEGFAVLEQYTNQHGNLSDAADSMMSDFIDYYGDYYGQNQNQPQGGEPFAPEFAQNIGPSAGSRQAVTNQLTPEAVEGLSAEEINDPQAIQDAMTEQIATPQDILGLSGRSQGQRQQQQQAQQILEQRRREQQEKANNNIWNFWGLGGDTRSPVRVGGDIADWAKETTSNWLGGDPRQGAMGGIGNTALDRDSQNRIANAGRGDFTGRSTRQFLSGRG